MIIGSLSHISYLRFAARLAPSPLIGLVLNFVWWRSSTVRRCAAVGKPTPAEDSTVPRCTAACWSRASPVTLVTVGLFFAGSPIALVALGAAAVLLLDRVRPEKVYESVDWPLLVMFAGLFVVVHAFEITWSGPGGSTAGWPAESPVVLVSGLSVVLSNLVSNVPAVLLFKPLDGSDAGEGAGLAGPVDVEHARRQPDRARLGGQPDRRRERPPCRDATWASSNT